MRITKPVRVSHSYTQRLVAGPATVFPLLCPVREADWIDSWDPITVISESGVGEPDCVFVTAAAPSNAIWYITRQERAAGVLEILKITPRVTACRIAVKLRRIPGGSEATVTYTHTSLGPDGDVLVAGFTEEYYRRFMQDWEARLNHYLAHGTALKAR